MKIATLLFEDFQTLDAFGPIEIFGRLKDLYEVRFYSLAGGEIRNQHGIRIITEKLDTINEEVEVFLIPGGIGTRKEIQNDALIRTIKDISLISNYVLTVCTGSVLLAKTGLLDNRKATSNKRAFAWVSGYGNNVRWDKKARWTVDGKYYTSSGVSAGIDMALGFLSDRHGVDFARGTASAIEYNWNNNPGLDTFTAE